MKIPYEDHSLKLKKFYDFLELMNEHNDLIEEYVCSLAKIKKKFLLLIDVKKYRNEYNDEQKNQIKNYYIDDGNYIIPEEFIDVFFNSISDSPNNIVEKINYNYKLYVFNSERSIANAIEWFPVESTFDENNNICYFKIIAINPKGIVIHDNEF